MSASDFNPYAAPRSFAPVEVPLDEGLWQTGQLLLMRKGTDLPDRCVKCNAPADGRRLRRAFSAMIPRQSVTLQVGVCYDHMQYRRWGILVGWCSFAAGLGLIFLSWMPESLGLFQVALCSGLMLMVAGPLYGLWRSQLVWARKIDKDYAWVAGVCNEYLAELPLIDMPP